MRKESFAITRERRHHFKAKIARNTVPDSATTAAALLPRLQLARGPRLVQTHRRKVHPALAVHLVNAPTRTLISSPPFTASPGRRD